MSDLVNFVIRHGEALVFVYVFADQIGVPRIPSGTRWVGRAEVEFSVSSVRFRSSPDSCVRRTEDVFLRYGVRSLLIAKFIPGLSTVAPPLAGMAGVALPRFTVYSAVAALLWAGIWGGLGGLAGIPSSASRWRAVASARCSSRSSGPPSSSMSSSHPLRDPGALRIAAEELERRHQDIPRDRDVIVYCS